MKKSRVTEEQIIYALRLGKFIIRACPLVSACKITKPDSASV
jgi:hypothetical protein